MPDSTRKISANVDVCAHNGADMTAIWAKIIDVQMHFNEICMKIRSFGLAAVGVILASANLAEVSFGKLMSRSAAATDWTAAQVVIFAAICVWLACAFADALWYHRLLLASVRHGTKFERMARGKLRGISLTRTISKRVSASCSWIVLAAFYLLVLAGLAGAFIRAG